MVRRQLRVAVFACGLVAVYSSYAADNDAKGKGREETRANATRKEGGPQGDAAQNLKPPLQTGEVKVPQGGVDTSRFDPNAGEGFKGKSSSGGGTIQPRGDANAGSPGGRNAGATSGAPLSGATAPKAPRAASVEAARRRRTAAARARAAVPAARDPNRNESLGASQRDGVAPLILQRRSLSQKCRDALSGFNAGSSFTSISVLRSSVSRRSARSSSRSVDALEYRHP